MQMDKSLIIGETSMKKLWFQTPTKLNDDIMNDIVNRLPAISNFRFKCVSKQWFILNTESLKRKSQTLTMSGVSYVTANWGKTEASMHYARTLKGPRNEDSSVDGTLSFLPKHLKMTIHCSCNGLLLCEGWNQNYPSSDQTLYVCNPATRKWVEIPYDCPKKTTVTILDFNPLDSIHFSVIMIGLYNRQYTFAVFSSKTEEWMVSKVTDTILKEYIIDDSATLIFKGLIFCLNREGSDVMGFDMEGNSCRRIELPGKSHRKSGFSLFRRGISGGCLSQSGGFLHYYYKSGTELYVWKLVDYESGLWSLKVNLCATGPLGDVTDLKFHPVMDEILIFVMEKFLILRSGFKIRSYNMRTRQIIELCSLPFTTLRYFPYCLCYLENFGKHGETM